MGKKLKIEIGHKFKMFTVIEELTIQDKKNMGYKSNSVFYKCLCDCGNISTLTASVIKKERSKSCGCIKLNLKEANFNQIYGEYKNRCLMKNI
jgi:hypothetical protein